MSALIIGDNRMIFNVQNEHTENREHSKSVFGVGNGEILQDIARSGRQRPWRANKYVSALLSESLQRLNLSKKSDLVRGCATFLRFKECGNPNCGHHKSLELSNFCRVRLCPMCAWRKSLVVAHQVKQVAHVLAQREKVRWLFLTLTIRNCEGSELKPTVTELMEGFRRLMMYKAVKGATLGWFRALEVTHNLDEFSESYDTYHPHFHVLIAVKPSYFGKGYIDQAQWTSLWKKAMKLSYEPVVHIQTVKEKSRNQDKENQLLADHGIEIAPNGEFNELPASVVAETAKYTIKSSDYVIFEDKCYCTPSRKSKRSKQQKKDYCKCGNPEKSLFDYKVDEYETDKAVSILEDALAHRRLYAYGGVLKDIWNELQANGKVKDVEDEDADLVHVEEAPADCKCSSCQSELTERIYRWAVGAKHYIG